MLLNIKRIIVHVFLSMVFIASIEAQVLSSESDLKNFKADDLTDVQVNKFVSDYEANGYSLTQVRELSIQKGLPLSEWTKLEARIKKLNLNKSENKDLLRVFEENKLIPRQQKRETIEEESIGEVKKEKIIFGNSLFNRDELTFEPNLNLPTPRDYRIGPGDNLIIDVYGYSENSYEVKVSPEGYIRIPNIGLVQVSGRSIDEATNIIKRKLSTIYTTIQSGETFVCLVLGNIRSIKVVIIGEAFRPGTYSLPSVATIFNALNVAGGPNDNGSFRNIKLIRNNKIIATVDIYDFLLTGELKNNLNLQDQDIIKIEPYAKRIELEGEVKNMGLFEAIDGETFSDLINHAGGYTNNAYKDRVTVFRNTDKERSVADISKNQFSEFLLQNGDHFIVGRILDRFLNRVQIAGSVYRPGTYALEENMTVKSLIDKADGVQDDAFLSRAIIVREKEDKTKELVSFNVEQLLSSKIQDILLQKEDSVYIASVSNMKESQKVSIWGEVLKEGDYSFSENMTLKDLVFIAGGIKEHAELKEVEVSRVIKDPDILKASKDRVKSYVFSLDRDLAFKDGMGEFKLEPLDHVIIRPISGFELAKRVKIEGEVYYPGSYILTSKNERISDVVKRAGGLNQYAFVDGAILFRKQKVTESEEKLESMVYKSISDGEESTLVKKEDFTTNEGIVGIDLKKILANPGSKWDLIMEENDIISIPRQLQTVQVSGEVFLPTFVRYDESMSFSDYIDNAGGFSGSAFKRKAYVVYANGTASSTKKVLFFKKYPKIKPGSRIYVPAKQEKQNKMSTAESISLANSSLSMAAVLMSLINTIF